MGYRMFSFFDSATEVTGYVSAQTASKARYLVYLSARDCGFSTRFQDVKIKRANSWDKHADKPRLIPTTEPWQW